MAPSLKLLSDSPCLQLPAGARWCGGSLAFPTIAVPCLAVPQRLRWVFPHEACGRKPGVSAQPSLGETYRCARSGRTKGPREPAVHRTPLMGLSKMPLHRHHPASPLPNEPSLVLRRAAYQAARLFRPCRFTRLRRLTPRRASQVCCTLQPVMGFAVFRSSLAGREVPRDACEESPLRRMPFEAFPSPAAASCHHDPCLLAVGPESPTAGTEIPRRPTPSATSRLCSTDEAVANALPLPAECCPLLPWASRSGTCSGPTRRSEEPRALCGTGEPAPGLLLSPTGEPEGWQPPSPMVPIDSAEAKPARRSLRRAGACGETSRHRSATRARRRGDLRRDPLAAQRQRQHYYAIPEGNAAAVNVPRTHLAIRS